MARAKLPEGERREVFAVRLNRRERERLAGVAQRVNLAQGEVLRRACSKVLDRLEADLAVGQVSSQ